MIPINSTVLNATLKYTLKLSEMNVSITNQANTPLVKQVHAHCSLRLNG